jgi:hypothetical protein
MGGGNRLSSSSGLGSMGSGNNGGSGGSNGCGGGFACVLADKIGGGDL